MTQGYIVYLSLPRHISLPVSLIEIIIIVENTRADRCAHVQITIVNTAPLSECSTHQQQSPSICLRHRSMAKRRLTTSFLQGRVLAREAWCVRASAAELDQLIGFSTGSLTHPEHRFPAPSSKEGCRKPVLRVCH